MILIPTWRESASACCRRPLSHVLAALLSSLSLFISLSFSLSLYICYTEYEDIDIDRASYKSSVFIICEQTALF